MFEYREPKIAIEAREYHALHTLDLYFPSYAPQMLSSDSCSRFLCLKAWQRPEHADSLHFTYNNALPQSLRPMGKDRIRQSVGIQSHGSVYPSTLFKRSWGNLFTIILVEFSRTHAMHLAVTGDNSGEMCSAKCDRLYIKSTRRKSFCGARSLFAEADSSSRRGIRRLTVSVHWNFCKSSSLTRRGG